MSTLNLEHIKKLGLGICAFESAELLCNIIDEIRDLVDYVVIGYQDKSYHGDPISKADLEEMKKLVNEKLADKLLLIELDGEKLARSQETDKRNILIQDCQDNGCTHCLIIDGDEFYAHDSFKNALLEIEEKKHKVTYCRYINYWHDYQHYLVYPFPEGMYVPFVTEVKYRFKFESRCFAKPSDPTRRYEIPAYGNAGKTPLYEAIPYEFPWKIVKMHHLSWIRCNIRKKLVSWSSKKIFNGIDIEKIIDKAVYVHTKFNTDNTIKQAELLFNTPDHKVDIEKLPKQYIYPKYDIYNRVSPAYDKKKILVLIESSHELFYKNYEKALKKSYIETIDKQCDNIDCYFYKGDASVIGNSYIDNENKTIYVNCIDSILHSAKKTCMAIKAACKDSKYDYVVKVNPWIWVNAKLVDMFLGCLDCNENWHADDFGFTEKSKLTYGSNDVTIFTKRQISQILLPSLDKVIIEEEQGLEDKGIYAVCSNQYFRPLGIEMHDLCKKLNVHKEGKPSAMSISYDKSLFLDNMFISLKLCIDSKGNSKEYALNERAAEYDRIVEIDDLFRSLQWEQDDYEKALRKALKSVG